MPIDKSGENIINKIQGLLATAESLAPTDPKAAENYRERADQMMVRYAIEQYELDQARERAGKPREIKPVVEMFNLPYLWESSLANDTNWSLFTSICRAIGLRTIYQELKQSGGAWHYLFKVIGYAEDIRYAELLYTSLKIQMLRTMDPKPDPSLSYDANVYQLHEAGVVWSTIAYEMDRARAVVDKRYRCPHDNTTLDWMGDMGCCPKCGDEFGEESAEDLYNWDYTPWPDGGRLIRAYRRECKRRGEEPQAVMHSESYRKSFSQAYVYRIQQRLVGARSEDSTAVVLARRQEDVDALWRNELPPVEEKEDEEPKKTKAVKAKKDRWSPEAARRGREAADRADLGYGRLDHRPDEEAATADPQSLLP